MNHKPLAQTAIELPEIGLGTWDYRGGPEPLHAGLDAGALFIDTAESYGSEPVVAEAIRGIRERVFLATKVSGHHLRRVEVLAAAEQSLRRLRTDWIDLYQIHEPNQAVPLEETLDAMEELADAGKVRFIGVSNFSVSELERASQSMRRHPIVSNQVRYNLADRTIEGGLLTYCQAHHITVIGYSPLGRELHRLHDCDPRDVLSEVAREVGKTVPQVALNWCLYHEGVVVIPKGNSIAHVLDNCGASGWRLSAEQFRRLDEGILFRRRTGVYSRLRRLVPNEAGPFVKKCIRRLPPALRRRLN
jgi:diketogulonate reductase-like aldo/keto reductase